MCANKFKYSVKYLDFSLKPNIIATLGDKLTARKRQDNSGCTITHWQISGPLGPCYSPNENCGYFGVSVNCKNRAE